MIENDSLPLLLISTDNSNCVNNFLADLLQEERSVEVSNDSRVWPIQNKYYRAQVRLHVWTDGAPPPPRLADRLEAHLIYVRAAEGEEAAERRAAAVEARAHVRLAVLEGPETERLAAWATRRRYELVPLAPDADALDEGADAYGADRARAALHAHTWRGLELSGSAGFARPPDSLEASDDEQDDEEEDAWGEWAGWGLVEGARQARGVVGAEPDCERRQRAEALLQAFIATLRPRAP